MSGLGRLSQADFDILVAQLPRLDAAQLTAVRQRIQLLGGAKEVHTDEVGPTLRGDNDWLYTAACSVLHRRGKLRKAPPLKTLNKAAPNFGHNSLYLRSWLERQSNFTRTEDKLLLGERVVEALLDYTENWKNYHRGENANLVFVLLNISHIPNALDAVFPGYVRAGMLSWLAGK